MCLCFSGCDRHLFGLQMIAMEQGMDTPELFKDPAWTKRFVATSVVTNNRTVELAHQKQ